MDTNPQSEPSESEEIKVASKSASFISNCLILSVSLLVALVSIAVYWGTAFRTITWWDSGEYAAAAITLGVPNPPGSLLTVLLGWMVTKFASGATRIVALNFFAGAIAAIISGLVCGLAISLSNRLGLWTNSDSNWRNAVIVAAAAGVTALSFSFSETLWTHAVKFTPYVVTPLLTALLLWALIRWWDRAEHGDAVKWLSVAAVLFGLDFSVHRTNLLLLPGVFVWITLRHPRTFLSLRSWWYSISVLAIGLSIHLLIIPLAARSPFLNFGDPSSWSTFWDYITLRQYGGGWLINLFPRTAPFFSVQIAEYLRMFADNFLSLGGRPGLPGALPTILGLVGLWWLWLRNRRMAIGMITLFLLASVGGVIYFNTPEHFIRSMDRHYLPSLLIFAVWIVIGALALMFAALRSGQSTRKWATVVITLFLLTAPVQQLARNLSSLKSANVFFAYDFAKNALGSLPPNAILFTGGDNDTYPLWCLQQVEGFRTDVEVLNINLMNTSWYVEQLLERDPTFPLRLRTEDLRQMRVKMWRDTTITVAVQGKSADFDLPASVRLPDSLHLQVGPDIANKYQLVQSQLLLQMLADNHWKRPICFMATISEQSIRWLGPYLRFDGMAKRLVPVPAAPLNKELLRRSLIEQYSYRGYADSSVPLDETSRMMGYNYYAGLFYLANAELEDGDTAACEETRRKMLGVLPTERLHPPSPLQQGIDGMCRNAGEQSPN